ncbi:MAG TPA: pyridoxamine 5'-phosphate oxidase family protein [Terriglobales bacterium]|nr:pyridoxamine 5'-phosphate oxidase family protein [Terriglobales bacterium]
MQATSPDGSVWHEGELAVQLRAGVEQVSGRGIRSSIPDGLIDFLREPRLVAFASVDSDGRTWASLRVGYSGFLRVVDAVTLETEPADLDGDPLLTNLKKNPDVGMVIVDLASRQRVRLNGEAQVLRDNSLRIQARQVYGNCPQYIQLRVPERASRSNKAASLISHATRLSQAQREWIAHADTLFIASAHPDRGVDASHRGGNPGFVKVEGTRRLIIPDYSGNNMFNTLGNISANPRTGLLFPDFEQGRTLQLSGTTTIDWDSDRSAFPGAQRLLIFDIDKAIEIDQPALASYTLREYSPFNP